jgi:D-alanyl-D-alanine dipeptidase
MYYSPPPKRKNTKHKKMMPLFHKNNIFIVSVFCFFLFDLACNNPSPVQQQIVDLSISEDESPSVVVQMEEKSPVVLMLDSLGFVDIQQLEPSILVDLKYATTDNFMGEVLYPDFHQAYLHPDAAAKLVKAQQILQEQHPEFSLLVYDAARPLSIQRMLWESVKGTSLTRYVANPQKTGLHNYGMAVDVTIADSLQIPLDMGTPFDYFKKKAGISHEDSLLMTGLLTQKQINNRRLLRNTMRQAGFHTIGGEWWHFNACSLSEARERYLVIE